MAADGKTIYQGHMLSGPHGDGGFVRSATGWAPLFVGHSRSLGTVCSLGVAEGQIFLSGQGHVHGDRSGVIGAWPSAEALPPVVAAGGVLGSS